MSGIAPVSQHELSQRRQQLRRQRRTRFLQGSWRSLVVLGLAGATGWAITQPNWVIRQPSQIKIEGNQFLSSKTLRDLLPIQYPQSLLRVQTADIEKTLTTKAPIAEVAVERQLFPPGLTIRVRERKPVAQAILGSLGAEKPKAESLAPLETPSDNAPRDPATADSKQDETDTPSQGNSTTLQNGSPSHRKATPEAQQPAGLLDEQGMWLPIDSYKTLKQKIPLPNLKVIGDPNLYRQHWNRFYPAISRSPVKIQEINWLNPNNLILKTDLGTIHVGPYGRQFIAQLRSLDRLRNLTSRVARDQIDYINLRNPENPTVQMKTARTSTLASEAGAKNQDE
ncbi:MAG: FtsQ-type POTRA domain-containing protein [Synechococcales bacterium]|nr:FtsQ-type POTRA domain-containing protein [Synechococcales bacterium]